MNYEIILSSEFENDVDEAIQYYKKINIGLAREILNEIIETKNYILLHPQGFQIRYRRVRIAFLKKFPFGIHYTIKKRKIYILSLFHSSANLNKRLK
jgi:hypothetical protein